MRKRYTIYLDKELYKKITKHIYYKETSLAGFIREYLIETLKNDGFVLDIPIIKANRKNNLLFRHVRRNYIKVDAEEIKPQKTLLSQEEMLQYLEGV